MIYIKAQNKFLLKDDFNKIIYPKSTKEFRCESCHELIFIDDIYCKSVGKYYGIFYSNKICLECAKRIKK